jgi:hypothetical protein
MKIRSAILLLGTIIIIGSVPSARASAGEFRFLDQYVIRDGDGGQTYVQPHYRLSARRPYHRAYRYEEWSDSYREISPYFGGLLFGQWSGHDQYRPHLRGR